MGCLLLLLLVLCLGCGAVLQGLFLGTSGEAGPDIEELPSTFLLAVNLEGENLQWTRVLDSAGRSIVKGDETGLEGSLDPGTYTLAVKAIGRPTVKGDFSLEEDLTLVCALQKSGEVDCDGLPEPLVLMSN